MRIRLCLERGCSICESLRRDDACEFTCEFIPVSSSVRKWLRELRAGDFTVMLSALAVSVAAVAAVSLLTERIGAAVRQQAAEVLAADLAFAAPSQPDPQRLDRAGAYGLQSAETWSFATVAYTEERTALSSVVAVSGDYPLRGEVRTSERPFGPDKPAGGIPRSGEVWVDAAVLAQLDIEVGQAMRLGSMEFRATRVLRYRPDPGTGFQQLGPTVLANLEDVAAMGVVMPGSRVSYRQLFAGPKEQVLEFRRAEEGSLRAAERMQNLEEASRTLAAAVERAGRFLGLAALVSVVLAAVATALAARSYTRSRLVTAALEKCLGATQEQVFRRSLAPILVVCLLGVALGSAAGFIAHLALSAYAREVINLQLPPATWRSLLPGTVIALAVTGACVVPWLRSLAKTSPLRVLRQDMPMKGPGPLLRQGAPLAMILAIIALLAGDRELALWMCLGLVLTAAAGLLLGWLLIRVLSALRGAGGVAWRHGLANVRRGGGESVAQVAGFGLGLMAVLLLGVMRTDLLDAWRDSLPQNAPNYFFINIAPDEWPGMRALLSEQVPDLSEALPFIRARITHINGIPAQEWSTPLPEGRRSLERSSNLSWSAGVPQGDRVIRGEWWEDPHQGPTELSADSQSAARLGVTLGDRVTFDVGGVGIEAELSNLRSVDWDTFNPNFQLVLSPNAADLPHTMIASAYIPPERGQVLMTLLKNYPGVTIIDLDAIIGQARRILDRAGLAVQFVFAFSVLAAVVVVLAAVRANRRERSLQTAVLRTLGGRRATILRSLAVEFGVLGGLAGVLGAGAASLLGLLLAEQVFDLDYSLDPGLLALGIGSGAVLIGLAGVLAARRALKAPLLSVLRGD